MGQETIKTNDTQLFYRKQKLQRAESSVVVTHPQRQVATQAVTAITTTTMENIQRHLKANR